MNLKLLEQKSRMQLVSSLLNGAMKKMNLKLLEQKSRIQLVSSLLNGAMKKMNLKLLEQKSRIQPVPSLLMTITRQGSCGVQLTPPSYFPLFCFIFGASLQKTTIPCWVFPFFCFIYL